MEDFDAGEVFAQRRFEGFGQEWTMIREVESRGMMVEWLKRGEMFNFEKLETWREAIAFADRVYSLTRSFPEAERFGLTSQMRRAAVSISSNIAEGCSRSSKADYVRFVEIASGSLFEVVSQATIGRNQGFLTDATYQSLYSAAEKQSRMLSGLRRSLENS